MPHPLLRRIPLLPAFLLLLLCSRLAAQAPGGEVLRLRGIIDKDQQWSGRILITDDLTIQSGKVTVAAGTIVEFAQKEPGRHPTLTVGSADRAAGQLDPQGTAEKPVVFRTMPDTNPGRLAVNVHSRIVLAERSGAGAAQPSGGSRVPNDLTWQHVRFENLGRVTTKREGRQSARVPEAAVTINVLGGAHVLSVVECTFDDCTRLVVRAGDGAQVTIVGNRFSMPKERASVEVFGREGTQPAAAIAVNRNVGGAGLCVRSAPAMILDNVLVGPDAAIVVAGDASGGTRITGNYVHNTTEEDDGRYCLNCENPAALIEDNIFRGGSACVWSGSRRMSGNVLIAAPRLTSKVVRMARTHHLVQALPAGATFERNVLIGPAFSLLTPQPMATAPEAGNDGATAIVIRHNVFDGFAESNRAIHLNTPGRPPVPVAVFNNVFLRVPTLVYSEMKDGASLTYADHNAVAPPAERAFEQIEVSGAKRGEPGWSAKEVTKPGAAALGLSATPPSLLPDYDVDILSGKLTTSALRQRLVSMYRASPDSPLQRAGRPGQGEGEKEPSIGLPPP